MKVTIPKNWRPGDTEAMNKFFDKLPIVYNLDEVMEIDKRYNKLKKE